MTERGAAPDNGTAVERREAQRPTSLAARTPTAAILGNGDIAVGAINGPSQGPLGSLASSRRLPALHPLIGETETGQTHPASKEQGQRSVG